jgi:hypothetical protein
MAEFFRQKSYMRPEAVILRGTHPRAARLRRNVGKRSQVMDTRHSKRLLAAMFAKQARLLHKDRPVEEAKDLFVGALALMLFMGTSPSPAPIPVRARRVRF